MARNTLWSVCRRQEDGTLVVQQDNQWWDQIVWPMTVGMWGHATVDGRRADTVPAGLRGRHQVRIDLRRA